MTQTTRGVVCMVLFLISIVNSPIVSAEEFLFGPVVEETHIRFDNENWFTLPHPMVASFIRHSDGSTSGMTENGIPFKQYRIQNELGIRVERFEIEDHYHYIVEGTIVESFQELSIALAEFSLSDG